MRVVALLALLALVACSNAGRRATSASDTGPPCIPAATSAASAPPSTEPSPNSASGPPVPDLALACFAGGREVEISKLDRPVIINLWGSWCAPCRTELPALNTYAEKGTVLVLGIATEDSRQGAGSVIDDLGLGFPNLYDRAGKFRKALGSATMPVTLFVSADGIIRYTHGSGALDTAEFERLAREYLGVA